MYMYEEEKSVISPQQSRFAGGGVDGEALLACEDQAGLVGAVALGVTARVAGASASAAAETAPRRHCEGATSRCANSARV